MPFRLPPLLKKLYFARGSHMIALECILFNICALLLIPDSTSVKVKMLYNPSHGRDPAGAPIDRSSFSIYYQLGSISSSLHLRIPSLPHLPARIEVRPACQTPVNELKPPAKRVRFTTPNHLIAHQA